MLQDLLLILKIIKRTYIAHKKRKVSSDKAVRRMSTVGSASYSSTRECFMTSVNSERHVFSFEGGDQLTTIGATFLVSYLFHQYIDSTHKNWEKIKTKNSRVSTINRSENYHRNWLNHIGSMSDANLNRNTLGLDAPVVKKMALEIQQHLSK